MFLYIDPSTVSVLITAISGVAIAVSATAVILWRKFKKTVAKVVKIDENANKEVEEDVVITDGDEAEAAPAESTSDADDKAE